MKRIIDPVVGTSVSQNAQQIKQPDHLVNSTLELGPIQKDRSFLPDSKDKPVHKCGC